MHRFLAALLSLAAALTGGWLVAFGSPATAQVPLDDPRRGLVYDGLRRAPVDSLCGGAYEALLDERHPAMKQVLCTHGPDPAPEGVDVLADRPPDATAPSAVTAADSVPCYGTGTDGYRVQLVYARASTRTDRFPSYEASFRAWAARMNQVVRDSAAKTGGTRNVRFVTDAACNPVIARVTLSSTAMSSFSGMVTALHSQGYARTDRKYMVWADTNVYCGISELYVDDSQDPTPGRNFNNGNPFIQGSIGRVDNGCWGLTNLVEAHELLHVLGGVQASAPNATPGFHCLDESDRLCYADGSTSDPIRYVCPSAQETLFDCNSDDYFHTSPAAGSYLATHWNTANSAFLAGSSPVVTPTTTTTLPPPTTTTTTQPPATTTTTLPPPTTATTTTAPPAATTTTAPPAATTTTAPPPPVGSVPSAPRSLSARQPAVGSGVVLSWEPPTSGPVTGYRVYRGTSPYTMALVATVGDVLGYHDASAGPTMYYFQVSAFNAAGEGPRSPYAGMIGKAASAAGAVREGGSYGIPSGQLRTPWGLRWA